MQQEMIDERIERRPGDMTYVPQNAISKTRKYLPTTSMGMYADPAHY